MKLNLLAILLLLYMQLSAQSIFESDIQNIYTMNFANINMQIDANRGAKISSIQINNQHYLLTPDKSYYIIWGSTLWHAPQKEWNWPPPMNLDNGLYTVLVKADTLICVSPIEANTQFIKKYWINVKDTSLSIEYEMKYTGNETLSRALWEVTRVPTNGLVFWVNGKRGNWGKLSKHINNNGNLIWLDLEKVSGPKKKLFADAGEGWLAHVNSNGLLMLRVFENISEEQFAEGEGEIEIYVDGLLTELENLSAAYNVSKGNSIKYATKWYFRHLPNNINAELGSSDLVKEVYKILQTHK